MPTRRPSRTVVGEPVVPDGDAEARLRRMRWLMLFVTMFGYLFFYSGRLTFGFAIPGIRAETGLNNASLGVISTAMLWCYAVGQAINGNLADKFGGRRIMSLGALGSTCLNWVTSLGGGSASLAIPWAANGYFQAMGWASGGRVINSWWPSSTRGRTYAFYTFAAGVGSTVAFGAAALVVDVWDLDWRWIFRLPPLLMLVGGVVFFVLVRDRPAEVGLPAPDERTDRDRDAPEAEGSWTRYRAVLGQSRIWLTGVSIGFQNAARYGLLVWVPVHFFESAEQSGSGVSSLWISVGLPIGMAIGAFVNGQISDRLFGSRRDKPIMLFMVLGAVAAITMFFIPVDRTALSLAMIVLTGLLVYGPATSFWALCPDLAGAHRAGTATGVVNFFSYLFAGFGEPTIGHIIDSSGNTSYVFVVVAVCCVASAAIAALIRR